MMRTKQKSRSGTKSGKPATFPGGGGQTLGTSGDNAPSNLGVERHPRDEYNIEE